MGKKISTLFLLLVLSIQMLPVQQIGNALFSNQFTEELSHSADTDLCKKETCKSDFLATPLLAVVLNSINLSTPGHPMADAIPQNHTGDIHVPPPNC